MWCTYVIHDRRWCTHSQPSSRYPWGRLLPVAATPCPPHRRAGGRQRQGKIVWDVQCVRASITDTAFVSNMSPRQRRKTSKAKAECSSSACMHVCVRTCTLWVQGWQERTVRGLRWFRLSMRLENDRNSESDHVHSNTSARGRKIPVTCCVCVDAEARHRRLPFGQPW